MSCKAQLDSCVAEYNKVRSNNIALVRKYESDYNDLAQIIDSTIVVFERIRKKYGYYTINWDGGGFALGGKANRFGWALQDIKNRFKVDSYENNFAAEKAYYQLVSNFILWFETNEKKAKKIKTVDELFVAAGITF